MIRVVIVDDERNSREVLKRLILETELDIDIVGEGDSVENGFNVINETNPDLIFLDVEMLDGTGFGLLEKFDEINFDIIFSTAYDKYAVKAFKYSALDYLLKPIDLSELEEVLQKVAEKERLGNEGDVSIRTLLENLTIDSPNKKIALKSATKIDFVFMDKISCLIAQGAYTEVVMIDGKKILSTNPLKHFDVMFEGDPIFFRISKSCLINLNEIKTFKKSLDIIELDNGVELELARRRRKEFLEVLNLV
tara:strand:+ start:599 stop:1348 length:750 start_codon:yes stop_codon:yes gene_type:complete